MKHHLDLFSGIGGFALAAENVWPDIKHTFCDNDPFSQAILRKHWPQSKIYDDIKTLRTPPAADIITGGFPCQPFSSAGKRRGTEDDRHLWPEMLRIIRLSSPRWVIGENVSGLLTWNGGLVLDQVCTDLEGIGYEVWPFVLPAAGVDAPHLRKRVWIVAHALSGGAHRGDAGIDASASEEKRLSQRNPVEQSGKSGEIRNAPHSVSNRGRKGRTELSELRLSETLKHSGDAANSNSADGRGRSSKNGREVGDTKGWNPQRTETTGRYWTEEWSAVAARLCTLDDGLPGGLARPRGWRNAALKGAGNAIVPQVAIQIMLAIKNHV